MAFVVATFYHFFNFSDFAAARKPLLDKLTTLGIKGSLLIAAEGINGTLSGSREAIDEYLNYLQQEIVHTPFEHKESVCDRLPFGRGKVRIKKEIISLGEPVSPTRTGTYVDAKDWNALIDDPDTIVLDARNSYEVHLGTFNRAIDPNTRTFKQLPAYVKKHLVGAQRQKIATFCTGGIRCEKFSAWLLEQGFEQVYQLKGGILKYLEEIPENESRWHGECYVFDERVAVGHGLKASDTATMCKACGHALTPDDKMHSSYIENTRCRFCTSKPR